MFRFSRETIFLTLAGSQAHGTAHEGSDIDIRGVCVAPLEARLSLFGGFEQYEGPLPSELEVTTRPRLETHATAARALGGKTECVIFDVGKFVSLCVAANPNILEILFADPQDWLLATPRWRRLHAERQKFLTKKVQHTFLGYGMAQLKKIQSHRAWLLNPPTQKPSREQFGMPSTGGKLNRDDENRIEQSIADKLRSYGLEDIEMPKDARIAAQARMDAFFRDATESVAVADDVGDRMRAVATHALSIPADVVAALNAEKKYRSALKHWDSFQTWQRQRNPARAELEKQHGYDTKHAMHLIRIMRMGLEVLELGDIHVRRDDAPELSAIRNGSMSYDDLLAAATSLRDRMASVAAISTLPDDVDQAYVDRLAVELMA